MSHKRKKGRKKNTPSIAHNAQSKDLDSQTAQELNQSAVLMTANSHSDQDNTTSDQKKKRAWYKALDANVIIAFGTILLGIVGIGSLLLTYWSLKESSQQFAAIQRARMVFGDEKGVAMELVDIGNTTRIAVHLRNDGHGTAYDVAVKAVPFVARQGQPSVRYNYSSLNPAVGSYDMGPMIGEGEPFTVYLSFNRAQADEIRKGTLFLRVVGRMDYSDEFGHLYCEPIGFLYQFDPDRFTPLFVPPKISVCDPTPDEDEIFSINPDGSAHVQFDLRKGITPFRYKQDKSENE